MYTGRLLFKKVKWTFNDNFDRNYIHSVELVVYVMADSIRYPWRHRPFRRFWPLKWSIGSVCFYCTINNNYIKYILGYELFGIRQS